MALPIIIFGLLILIALALFVFGASRESLSSGFAFIALSSVLLIVTGLFTWSTGIQLDQVSTIIDNGTNFSITYTEMLATNGSPIWIISNLLVFGGIGLTLLSLGLTIRSRRQQNYENQIAIM